MFKNIKITIYKAVLLPVILHGCEICYLTLREEHGLRMSENTVTRRIFVSKDDKVIRG
jgi:hypothetical protein